MSIATLHLAGAGFAALTVLWAHAFTASPRRALAAVLLAAALIYVGFALSSHASWALVSLELVGAALFGALAWAGVRFSLWWLVAGWVLHASWDTCLHLHGPAAGTAPEWYAHLCLSFDLVLAVYLVLQLLRLRAYSPPKPTPLPGTA